MIKIKKILGKEKKYLLVDGRTVSIADVKAGKIKPIVTETAFKIMPKKTKKKIKKKWYTKNEVNQNG